MRQIQSLPFLIFFSCFSCFSWDIWSLFQHKNTGISSFQKKNLILSHIKLFFHLFYSFSPPQISVVSTFSLPSKGITQNFIYSILIGNTYMIPKYKLWNDIKKKNIFSTSVPPTHFLHHPLTGNHCYSFICISQ